MNKIVFDLSEIRDFLSNFEVFIEGNVYCCGTRTGSEKIVYDIDEKGRIYSRRYIDDALNEKRFEEFIQGHIIDK
jgi:hypothetical protein